ncbi:hypothetical protein BP00DRAFT_119753 [Aspergillus indologenus CBS 114.80]|uniref:Uncharacterized protein n=1 Tax=Aspergillus indologenus CBS 114.80 TaxID=1450541 RepID=A0A2V5HR71_9EURO|nr:hypothetical protein BP00DRAFT_119753 [Aspergillus indologenus CBS 114.80]
MMLPLLIRSIRNHRPVGTAPVYPSQHEPTYHTSCENSQQLCPWRAHGSPAYREHLQHRHIRRRSRSANAGFVLVILTILTVGGTIEARSRKSSDRMTTHSPCAIRVYAVKLE